MFCPKCGTYLRDSDLIQRNIKYAMGNVAVEFDATCPNCSIPIGKMSWGQFTVAPELEQTNYEESPSQKGKRSLIPQPPELRTVLRPYTSKAAAPASVQPQEEATLRSCPHCGQLWPKADEVEEKY